MKVLFSCFECESAWACALVYKLFIDQLGFSFVYIFFSSFIYIYCVICKVLRVLVLFLFHLTPQLSPPPPPPPPEVFQVAVSLILSQWFVNSYFVCDALSGWFSSSFFWICELGCGLFVHLWFVFTFKSNVRVVFMFEFFFLIICSWQNFFKSLFLWVCTDYFFFFFFFFSPFFSFPPRWISIT